MKNHFGFFLVSMLYCLKVSYGCDNGWMEYGKYCYFIQNKELQGKSWRDASLSCQNMGAYLLSIEDDAESHFVSNIIKNDSMQNDKYWIGLNDACNNREFTWSDNTYPNYFNWLPKNPDNRGHGENCVVTNIYGWNDRDCWDNFHGFICKSVKVYNGSCADGWVNYKNHCYFFKKKDAIYFGSNWEDSYLSCLNKGGNLLSVENQEENLFVTSILENDSIKDQYFWIGLNYLQSYKKFVWSDNTHSKFFYWNSKVPNQNILIKSNFSNVVARCTVVNADSWDIQNCRNENKYICKVKRESNKVCANDWFEYASYCYYFQSKNDSVSRNWRDSFLSCLQKGGNLLSVDDQTENEFIINVLKSNKMNQDYWIGLTDRWYNTWFMWSDHTYLQYANPKFFKYKSFDLFDDCVRISKHYWDTKMCASLNGFICKVRRAINFCAENWVGFRRHCYFIQKVKPCGYSGNRKYSGNTWAESFSICQLKGGNLLSIEDQEEDLFIQNLIQDDCQYWIGLNKDWNYGKFVWSDNTYSQFFNWIENHQTDKNKNCVEMNSNGWNVNECNVSNGFICKVKKVSSSSLCTKNKSLISVAILFPALVVFTAVIV